MFHENPEEMTDEVFASRYAEAVFVEQMRAKLLAAEVAKIITGQ